MSSDWLLHPQLEQDTVALGDLTLSRVLISRDARYPWLILVPRCAGAVEIIHLGDAEQTLLMTEIAQVSRALQAVTACDKLNVAALGNMVPQLHVHIIARHRNDAAWPRPVWGVHPPLSYQPGGIDAFAAALRPRIWLD